MKKHEKIKIIEMTPEEIEALIERIEQGTLEQKDYGRISDLVRSYVKLTLLLKKKTLSMSRLQALLFGAKTEKTSKVLEKAGDQASPPETSPPPDQAGQEPEKKPRKGHGRNGADAHTGAERVRIEHEELKVGDPCPKCKRGKLYELKDPAVLVRFYGQAPIGATVYEQQRLRCNPCGAVFTAKPPEGVGARRYDETAPSMMSLLKYGSGMPYNRLEGLQRDLGILLPASTQWDLIKEAEVSVAPVHDELIKQAAQGEVVHNDDTPMKILSLLKDRGGQADQGDGAYPVSSNNPKRKGVYTSGIVSRSGDRSIVLFYTGRKHAGENLAEVLKQREEHLDPPIQMCDALSHNLPKGIKTVLGNCLCHGRRKFVEVTPHFPSECRHVLNVLKDVYCHEDMTEQMGLSPEERLQYHQAESAPLMNGLHEWMSGKMERREVEPNSGLGEAISYMLAHWKELTLFLRKAGAPLDNNIAERALKKAILNRKNAYFYKTPNGARVGDCFMSLIHTAELNGINPFDYLTELQRHYREVAKAPGDWMPWNYRKTLAGLAGQARPEA